MTLPDLKTKSAAVAPVVPGLLFVVALGSAAFFVAEMQAFKDSVRISALLLVLLVGIAWKSLLPVPEVLVPGIQVAQRPLLRWAVAGLGFRLSIGELVKIGGAALAVVVVSTFLALWFGWWLARRVGLDEKLGLLLGVGGAICGASAIVAADTVVQGEKRDVAVSLGIITLLGTIGILVYPLLGKLLGMSQFFYGVWDGTTLHEMAQVVAAGAGVGKEAVDVATVVKLARICLLAPVVFYLAWSFRRRHVAAGQAKVPIVPWFLVAFLIFVAVNSTGWLSPGDVKRIVSADLWLLTVGMAGVGLQTGFKDIRSAGWKAILVGSAQWLLLAVVAYGLALLMIR